MRHTEPRGISNPCKIDGFAKPKAISKNGVDDIGQQEADENQQLLHEATGVDGNAANSENSEKCNPGIKVRRAYALHCRRRKIKTDHSNDGAGHAGRHQFFNPSNAS